MATTPRAKPYFLDLRNVRTLDDLRQRLPNLFENADFMFQQLYSDLSGVATDVAAAGSSTPTPVATGPTIAQVLTRVIHGI